MILVGQYDSPYVRRVAISLRVLGFTYEHDTRSVFGDFDSMRQTNPIGRIPSLILDDGSVLVDSGVILDYLDEQVGPERALIPRSGLARLRVLQRVALASGAIDKAGAANYERLLRPQQYQWPDWITRLQTQAAGAIAALAAESWPEDAPLDQAQITTACLLRYVQMTSPDLAPPDRYPTLAALAARCEKRPEFQATYPAAAAYPDAD
jgi:glutathione S-transferase